MATTAAAVGSPTVNQKAATTVATRQARPRKTQRAAPGRFNAQRFQNPGAGTNRPRTLDRSRFQNPNVGRQQAQPQGQSQFRDMTTYGGRGAQAGGGQGQPPGAQAGGQYPGGTNWWEQRPPQPAQQQWGSPQFNYMGGNAPWAQPQGGPNWGGGGYGGGGYGGMPQGGMPGYQGQQYPDKAYQELQQRTYQQMMMNQMPWQLRNQYQFQTGAAGMGYGDPSNYSGAGQVFEGYGTNWGYSPQGWNREGSGNMPWSGGWNKYPQGGGGGGYRPGLTDGNVYMGERPPRPDYGHYGGSGQYGGGSYGGYPGGYGGGGGFGGYGGGGFGRRY